MMKKIKKFCLACLCGVLLVTQVIPTKQVQAASTNDDEFQMFLADVLVDNYLLDNVDQMMLHQYFYAYLKEQNGAINLAVTLTNMANDWGYAINGKTDLYEDILIELIHDYINSDLFTKEMKRSRERVEQELFSFLKDAIDFNQLKEDHVELINKINDMDFTSWDDLLDLPYRYMDDYVEGIVDRFELPVSSSYLLNLSMDTVDFLYEIVMYQSFRDGYGQIYQVLDVMYRQTQNTELRTAIKRVLDKLKAANHPQLWKIVEESMDEFSVNANLTTAKELVMTALTFVGLGIDTGGFISEVLYKSSTLSECQLLLEAELDIENAIKDVIYYKQNNYDANVENAIIFNGAMKLLYNAYDFGLEICEDYNEAVFDVEKRIYLKNAKEFMDEHQQKANDIDFVNDKHDYMDFNNAIKLWQSIADNDRTVFNTAWELYLADHDRIVRDFLEDFLGKTYIQGISFAQSHIILDMKDYNGSTFLTKVNINPTEASGTMITYTSSDPTILEIVNANMYRVNLLKEGTVTVTATTIDKLHTATQQVTIIDSRNDTQLIDPVVNGEYLDDYYEVNQDGITVTKVIGECVKKENNISVYYVPSKINDLIVTEVNFYNMNVPNKVVLSSTVKRISENGFAGKENFNSKCKVVLNEGLEVIGKNAFYQHDFLNSDVVIPSTLVELKTNAFLNTKKLNTVIVKSQNLVEIPKSCFENSSLKTIHFNEGSKLKIIGEKAFSGSNLKSILLPESIETIGNSAFQYTSIVLDKLPDNLVTIGNNAFLDSGTFNFDSFPKNIKSIGERAFESTNFKSVIYLPNTLEYLGPCAFQYTGDIQIFTYGEHNNSVKGAMNLSEFFSSLEIPSSMNTVKILNLYNYRNKSFNDKLYWHAGLDTFNYYAFDNNSISIYLKEGNADGTYKFSRESFLYNLKPVGSDDWKTFNIDYIEIPSNYLDGVTTLTNYKEWLLDVVIVNVGQDVYLDKYVSLLDASILPGGSISYKDKEGNITPLYERPSSYTKVSNYQYENHANYQVSGLSLLNNTIQDDVVNKNNILKLDATVSYDNETKSTLGSDPSLKIRCWEDGTNETKSQRAAQLGAYLNFEDLYLKQNDYRYFNLYFENVDVNQKGNYVIQLDVNNTSYTEDKTALYKIEGSKITRIPIQITTSGIITFETDTLGLFALAPFTRLEEKGYDYLEELHNLLDGQEIKVWYENPVTYETQNGTITIIGEDKNEENSSVVVSKPEISEEVKKEIIKYFDIDDTLIDEEIDECVINEEMLNDKKLWDIIQNSLIKIDTTQDNETIQIAITQLLEKYNALNLFKVEEVDGKLTLVDITKDAIRELKEKQANPLITSNNRDYYQLKLDNKGTYYFGLHESDSKVNYKAANSILPLVIGGIGFITIVGIIVLLILKKRTNN